MNILICNQWFPPSSTGGVAQYNEYVAEGLSEAGHGVVVVSVTEDNSSQHENRNGIHVCRVKMPGIPRMFSRLPLVGRQHRFLRNLLYSKSVCRDLKQIVHNHNIDLVEYADINGEGFFHRKYLRNVPYIVRCHTPYYLLEQTYDPGEMPFSCRFLNWMEKKTIKRANGVTAPSQDLAERIERWCELPSNSVVSIPNPIDTDWFCPDPYYKAGVVTKILFVGRIEKAKGIYVLADAMPKVVKTHTKVRFIFAGEPRNERGLSDFKSYLNKLGIQEYCEFAGGVTREKLRELYQQCDIFVNPSTIYESFSYTNAEAMACGKPVITSDIGGMPETVGDMIGGLVFRNKDSRDLAEKVSMLILNEELRHKLEKQARKRSKHYSVVNVIDKIMSFYQRVKAN